MTDRWSNPSGGLGFSRFRVWPAGTDSYSHSDLAANWDEVDALIGIPASGNWPPTTGINGGIYREVKLLNDEMLPIGCITPWFRPTNTIAIPTNWHVCDGTTLTAGQHAFPGIAGSVTLPDLRNSFILGADPTLVWGTGAAAVGSGSIDTAAGAPGEGATGGDNQSTIATTNMASHNHTFTGSALGSHSHSFTGNALGAHSHYSVDYPDQFTQHEHLVEFANDLQGGGGRKAVVDFGGFSGATDIYAGVQFSTSADAAGTPSGAISTAAAGTPAGTISSSGSGTPMDNRPRWTGLIYICKVLYATTP